METTRSTQDGLKGVRAGGPAVYFLLLFSFPSAGRVVDAGDQILPSKQAWPGYSKQTKTGKHGACYCWGLLCRLCTAPPVYLPAPSPLHPTSPVLHSSRWLSLVSNAGPVGQQHEMSLPVCITRQHVTRRKKKPPTHSSNTVRLSILLFLLFNFYFVFKYPPSLL